MSIVADYLAGFTGRTLVAYTGDVAAWAAFLGRDELTATRTDADAWVASLHAAGLSASTIKRRIAAVAGLYNYALDEELIERSPFAKVRRPRVSEDSQTLGLAREEAVALLAAAREDSARAHALVSLLLHTAMRIDEALSLDITDVAVENGVPAVRVTGKGGKVRVLALGGAELPLAALIGSRTSGLVFAGRNGKLAASTAFREIQRLAKAAGLADADRITPHSLRHTAITAALAAGASIQDVQDMAGHATPQMTQRYNRARHNLHSSPAHALTDYYAA